MNPKIHCYTAAEAIEEHANRQIFVVRVGSVCVYCGKETEAPCCGEIHHEVGFETENGELLLESELTQFHEILED